MDIFKVERTGYPSLLDTSKVEVYNLCSNKCDCAFSSQIVGKTYREKRSNKCNVHEVPYISPKGIPLKVTLKASARKMYFLACKDDMIFGNIAPPMCAKNQLKITLNGVSSYHPNAIFAIRKNIFQTLRHPRKQKNNSYSFHTAFWVCLDNCNVLLKQQTISHTPKLMGQNHEQ